MSSTSPMAYNTERRISSEDHNNLNKETTSVGSKSSHKVTSDNKPDLEFFYDGITNVQYQNNKDCLLWKGE